MISVSIISNCYEGNSLLHWSLSLLSASSMPSLLSASSSLSLLCASSSLSRLSASSVSSLLSASSVPSWECQVSIFSPAWHSIIGLHEVLLPLFLIISSVSRSWMSTRLQFSAHCFHHAVQSSFTLDSSLVRCYGVFRYALVVTARTFVRPLFSYICSSLVRRAFLHLSILFSFVSPLPQGVSPSIRIRLSSAHHDG